MAKAYRLLHAIMTTAVNVDQVLALADAVQPRYRCLVLLAAFTSVRFGELAALRKSELNLVAGEVHVLRSPAGLVFIGPKAGSCWAGTSSHAPACAASPVAGQPAALRPEAEGTSRAGM